MSITKCVEPDVIVYGVMGMYGQHQRHEDYIAFLKLSIIRAAAAGDVPVDYAAEEVVRLQTAKPTPLAESKRVVPKLTKTERK